MTDQETDQGPEKTEGVPAQERPFVVQSFTVRYDPIEDRICLNSVDASGAKQAIFMTRRLMDQIIPLVVKLVEEKTPMGVPADLVHSMTQERARQMRKAEPPEHPVQAGIDALRWLCSSIEVSRRPKGLAVILAGGAASKAQLTLSDSNLRTVLDIFRNNYAKAGWDLRVFPNWLGPEPSTAEQGLHGRMH
jgi:hypothetical protein